MDRSRLCRIDAPTGLFLSYAVFYAVFLSLLVFLTLAAFLLRGSVLPINFVCPPTLLPSLCVFFCAPMGTAATAEVEVKQVNSSEALSALQNASFDFNSTAVYQSDEVITMEVVVDNPPGPQRMDNATVYIAEYGPSVASAVVSLVCFICFDAAMSSFLSLHFFFVFSCLVLFSYRVFFFVFIVVCAGFCFEGCGAFWPPITRRKNIRHAHYGC